MKRRTLLQTLAGSAVLAGAQTDRPEGRRFRIWDEHCHLYSVPGDTPEERMSVLIECADRLGIERLLLSQGYSSDRHPTADQLRTENDRVMRAVRRFPDRAYGSVYLSPAHPEFSVQEFDRCVRDGPMVCVGELEADRRCNVPEMDVIVERAASMKVPILQHTWMKTGGNDEGESSPYDVVELAQRHPDVSIVCVHTGGDWERGIRVIRAAKNVYALGLAGRVRLMRGDLLGPLAAQAGRLAMVVANLPYLPSAVLPTLPREVRDFEPRAALDGGPDGLALLRRLVAAAPGALRPGGRLVLEIGEEQAGALASLMAAEGFTDIASRADLRGIERYIAGAWA